MDLIAFFAVLGFLTLTFIRQFRDIKALRIETLYKNDKLLAAYLIWTFLNLILFFTSTKDDEETLYPFDYGYTGVDSFNAQELLVYVVGPIFVMYLILLFKRNRRGTETSEETN